MKIEHIALNVKDPVNAAKWYVDNLGMRIVRAGDKSPFVRFLADSDNQGLIELYANPTVPVPDYATMDCLAFHLAFAVDDMEATRARLLSAGATAEGDINDLPNGDQLAMLRDPWGVPLQLARRGQPLI